mmetsp:Transcript_13701/g.33607  ORF Transcript_13701/g.33607 Transcript_13701/m.33607 type:complete len:396 (-) Transcript_13701:177-1364(-)
MGGRAHMAGWTALLLAAALLQSCSAFAPSSTAPLFRGGLRHASPRACAPRRPSAPLVQMGASQLEQLASMTVLSVDTGDLNVIKEQAATGAITDATTNPLFVSQAGLSGDPTYIALVDDAVAYAKKKAGSNDEGVALAMDRLAVNLGKEITKLVKGYVSTEVDPRLSFDVDESVKRALRIIEMYEEEGVPKSRVLIKLAATWEGILAAEILEKQGITCNLTLVFGILQAAACAQRGVRLISPFPGRILDWHTPDSGKARWEPSEDPGVVECTRIFNYYKKYGHDTICMPASWRPSRGKGYDLDEIRALAGSDRMTIPPNLLKMLAECDDPLPRMLEPRAGAAACTDAEFGGGRIEEKEFRFLLNQDACTTDKMSQGIRAFVADTNKLEAAIRSKM